MSRLVRDLVVALVAIGVLGAIVWTFMSTVTITTRNEAGESASDVTVGFTERTLWHGDLVSGQSKWTFGIPRRDGAVEVSYEIAGQRFKIECGYVTAGLSGKYEIVVRSSGEHECEYE